MEKYIKMPFELRMKIYTHDNIPEGVVNIPDSFVSISKPSNGGFSPTLIHLNPNDYKKLINFLKNDLMDLDKMREIKERANKLNDEERKIVTRND